MPLSVDEREALDDQIKALQTQLNKDADEEGGGARKDNTGILVAATISLAALAVVSITTIFIVRPDRDNTALIATLLSVLVPLMTGLLAAAVQQVHLAVNSRLTQLLRMTAEKSRAEGRLDAISEKDDPTRKK